jgi:predicted transcriptional regulator
MDNSLRKRAEKIINELSDKKLAEVIDFLEYVKLKEELEATEDILNDKKLMEQIKKGIEEARNGEVFDLEDVVEDV